LVAAISNWHVSPDPTTTLDVTTLDNVEQ